MRKTKTVNYNLNEAEKLSDEGVMEFAQTLLETTYKDYKSSMQTIMELKGEYAKENKVARKYYDYATKIRKLKKIMNKKPCNRTKRDKAFLKKMKRVKPVEKPSKEILSLIHKYENASSMKIECERFYRGEGLKIWTLGADVDPEEIIAKIKKEVGWIDARRI